MLRSILAVLAASVIVFIWGYLSWGVLPWHQPQPFENGDAVSQVIKANTSEHGMYAYPGWATMREDSYSEQWSNGPTVYAMVRPGPRDKEDLNSTMLHGFLINILAASALLLLIQKSGHTEFLDRLSIALLAGLFLVSSLNAWNWMEFPGMETIATLADGIVPWTLAGAAIAAILPKKLAD